MSIKVRCHSPKATEIYGPRAIMYWHTWHIMSTFFYYVFGLFSEWAVWAAQKSFWVAQSEFIEANCENLKLDLSPY